MTILARSRRLARAALLGAALPLIATHGASATTEVEVFGPGTISVQGESLYKGTFTPDGREFLFFRKVGDAGEDFRIYRSGLGDDGWGSPELLDLGAPGSSDLYPAVSPDGRWLVFSSYRPFPGDTTSSPNANLWFSAREGDGWRAPHPMLGASVPANYDAGPWFDSASWLHYHTTLPDWSQTFAMRVAPGATLAEGASSMDPLIEPFADWREGLHVWSGTPSPDGSLMILDVSEIDAEGRRGPTDLWAVWRHEGEWTEPRRLDDEVNRPESYENFVVFSPDGGDLFFVRGFATYYRLPVDRLPATAGR
ncbi:MAG: hypothetical protein ABFS34_13590 [Gemmatimonadota bacterium]